MLSNEEFACLAPAKKRVAIAKDVLAQLELSRIIPQQGVYLRTAADANKLSEADECHACAIGAMFACLVERTPGLKFSDNPDRYTSVNEVKYRGGLMRKALTKFFSKEQLGLIEAAFECDYTFASAAGIVWAELAERFGRRYHHQRDRMRAIMENIITNGGKFVP